MLSTFSFQRFSFSLYPWLLLLAAIWVPVVYLLGAQWSVYEQYHFGWAVPFLCLYLAWQRLQSGKQPGEVASFSPLPSPISHLPSPISYTLLAFFALAYWAMRVLQEADPIWRLASYGLAGSAVALTLLVIYLTSGGRRVRQFLFPVAFFLVAVPWPTPVESLVIQNLTEFNAGLVVEALNFGGVAALQHGNLIEVGTGLVGIDEACSGIRSLQATLMLVLFMGELYALGLRRRVLCVLNGFALALVFNLARTFLLVLVAAQAGLPAMQRWHDPTGVALLLGCFLSVWGVALWLARKEKNEKQKAESGNQQLEIGNQPSAPAQPGLPASSPQPPAPRSQPTFPLSVFPISALAFWLFIWAVVVEGSTEAWFRSHEARGPRDFSWVARWPAGNPTLRTTDLSRTALEELQCDQHAAANWTTADGVYWQAFYLRWLPANHFYGRVRVALSKSHNPAICLPAAGMKLESQLDPVSLPVSPGFSLVFDRFVFNAGGRLLFAFFSQTEDMAGQAPANLRMTPRERWRAVLAGSRNYGQRNLEFALVGPASAEAALQLVRANLPDLIQTRRAGVVPSPGGEGQ